MFPKKLFVYRHGQTEFNVKQIVQGSGVNTNLNLTGFLQARSFYQAYKNHPFDVVLTSTLKRSYQTAWPFIQKGIPWEALPYFDEISWGDHEGLLGTPETIASYRAMIQAWENDQLHASLPNGESAKELFERIHMGIDYIKKSPHTNILICMHGRSMRALVAALQNQHPKYMEQYSHNNTGLYQFKIDTQQTELIVQNNIDHLPKHLR